MSVSTAPWLQHPAEGLGRMRLPSAAPTVSVVIPMMNEAKNLPWLSGRMPLGVAQIVIVDGGSIDGSVDVAKKLWPDATIIDQTRRGKGNALACGIAAATGDIVVTLDADGSAHPSEIVRFVSTLMAGAEFAKGSRFLPGGGSSDITRLRRLGNHILSWLVNSLHRTNFSDLCYGYNAFRRECVPLFLLPAKDGHETQVGDGFEIETLINLRAARSALTVTEVPSYESNRLHGASNLNAISDGLRVLRVVLRERFGASRVPSIRAGQPPVMLPPPVPVVDGINGHMHVDPGTMRAPEVHESPSPWARAPLEPADSNRQVDRVSTTASEVSS